MDADECKGFRTLAEVKLASRWLNRFEENFHSQSGEDGVIGKALEVLPERDGWCVEFGAWDGRYLSNTFHLVESAEYRVVLIEGDRKKYEELASGYPIKGRAIFLHRLVGWSEGDNLDCLLAERGLPADFDFLSIDIDGNDYHVWKAVERFRPKLVMVEFNPTSSNRFEYIQPADAGISRGNSPAALVSLGREKGYELICVVGCNLLFVDRKYFQLFQIEDNSLDAMRDGREVNHLFVGHDGTLLMDGPGTLPWHGKRKVKLRQPLPAMLRRYPPQYGRWRYRLFRMWAMLFLREKG